MQAPRNAPHPPYYPNEAPPHMYEISVGLRPTPSCCHNYWYKARHCRIIVMHTYLGSPTSHKVCIQGRISWGSIQRHSGTSRPSPCALIRISTETVALKILVVACPDWTAIALKIQLAWFSPHPILCDQHVPNRTCPASPGCIAEFEPTLSSNNMFWPSFLLCTV